MEKREPKVDEYIIKSADFAKPVLIQLREMIHKASPDIYEEIKWGMPAFNYKGFLCGMAAFKNHCAFNFWKSAIMPDPDDILSPKGDGAMGNLGKIITVDDLPKEKIFIKYIKAAMKLNDEGKTVPKKKPASDKKELVVPDYFVKALKKNKAALNTFEGFSNSHKKEYVEWITEAKTDETREKRIATSVEWLSEGKSRMWKYKKT